MATTNAIQTIKDYFARNGGLQLTNRFTVDFYNIPSYGNGNEPVANQTIHAQEVILPPRVLETVADQLQGYGPGRFVPRNQRLLAASGVMMTFPVTNNSFVLDFFNRWFNYFYSSKLANNNSSQNRDYILPYYDDAVKNASMIVRVLDPNGNINNNIVFTEIFPIETQPVVFSMKTENTYLTYQVVIGFRDFYYQIFNNP
jgi:hypothetical protein